MCLRRPEVRREGHVISRVEVSLVREREDASDILNDALQRFDVIRRAGRGLREIAARDSESEARRVI